MGSYNPLVFVLGLVTAAGVTGVAYMLALARGGESRVLGREYGPIFVALGLFALGGWPSFTGRTGRGDRCLSTRNCLGWEPGCSLS